MRPKVYMSSIVPSPAFEIVSEYCDVQFYQGEGTLKNEEILANIRGKDGLICLVGDRIGKEVMDAGSELKMVSTASVGFEHIDVQEASKRGIYVGYAPDVLTDATADLAFALLLGAGRRIAEADGFVRAMKWKVAWSPTAFLGASVCGKTIGIIGLGRIGRAVARRAKGFNMKILYSDAMRSSPETEGELGAEFRDLEDLLGESDFVTIQAPLTKETVHLINEERLRRMKPEAILINTSRGSVVDESALVKVLRENVIGGAGIDVFEKEPIDSDNPLLEMENVVLLPHIGSATKEARRGMGEVAARNLLAVLRGESPAYWLNPEVEKIRSLADVKMI